MRSAFGFVPVVCVWFLACTVVAIAGQSIVLSTGIVGNPLVAAQGVNGACRAEVSFHDWDPAPPPSSHPWDAPACGFSFTLSNLGNGDVRLTIYSPQGVGGEVCMIRLGVDANGGAMLPSKFATVRFQRVPNGSGGIEECEAIDVNGRTFWNESHLYTGTSGGLSAGASVGGTGQNISTAYFRLFTTTVPMGSRPPVTADKGDLLEWKFDGDLSDSSGHGYDGVVSNGSPFYVPTPGQDLVVAVIKTSNAPTWSPWVSMRAGYPNQLGCSDSYAQADASAAVTCDWTVTSGPSALGWSGQSTAQPTVTNVVFGTYRFSLQVSAVTGDTATRTLDVGAVAYDDDGVVIPDDPRVTEIFGPMIAYGQNPWGYADERAKRAVELQNAYYLRLELDQPTWETSGQGTVSYSFAGIGMNLGQAGTTLSGSITGTATSIPIADAGQLPGLGSLPTWIWIGNAYYQQELVRVCSTTATSGAATLGVCYDGRGLTAQVGTFVGAQGWNAGTVVGEYRVQGSGTRYVTDAKAAICPGGGPGPPGPVVYSTGTVTLTGGSTTIAGNGASWTTANKVIGGYFIRVEAMHGGGIPFVYWATITSVDSPTQVRVNRALPGDVDGGPFPYNVISYRYISLHFIAPDGSDQNLLQPTAGCESETAVFASVAHDIPALNLNQFIGMRYSYKDGLGIQSAFGPNFYGSGLAARAFYLRSGWDFAKQTADMMDERWVRDPEIGAGWAGGIPLLQGGGVVGAIADLVTNPTTALNWSDVRQFGVRGAIGSSGCNDYDTRDSGVLEGWVALLALFDPDDAQRANWLSALLSHYRRDTNCKQADGSWANGFYFNGDGPVMNVTNGSALVIAPGNNFTPGMCSGVSSGTAIVTNGTAAVTSITGAFVAGAQIVLTGTRNGSPYSMWLQFQLNSGNLITLGGLWPGDSGTVSWLIAADQNWGTIAKDTNDSMLRENWSCTYNSPSQITLHRPWDGPTDNTGSYHLYSSNLAGFGQQPFMLGGYKESALKWASQVSDQVLVSNFANLTQLAAIWIHDVGYDPETQGMSYGRIFQACEPAVTASMVWANWKATGCQTGGDPDSIRAARTLTAETSNAIRVYYESNPSQSRKDWGDHAYGSIWGYCPYTKPGYYCDDNYVRGENSDTSLGAYKWTGFFFGMGMAHQWPAVRSGSVRRRGR
ncbi:MAG: hypothetical protein JWO19_3365 [Bryobacterales bacterium]|nr:hypothetical protein [Bryobacterales bacterium]